MSDKIEEKGQAPGSVTNMPSNSSPDPYKKEEEGSGSGEIITTQVNQTTQPGTLKRGLKNRHVAMISLGGVIGTGLFLGSAKALRNGGPLGLLLGYSLMGLLVYSVMISLGEMIAYLPVAGGHITMATRFVSADFAFALGWNYWYNWTIVLPTEMSAAAVLISYWDNPVPPAVWITICLIVVVLINLGGAKLYGEMEFWFCIIKILTIVGLIFFGVIYAAGGVGDHPATGFDYWNDPGAFRQFLGIDGAWGRFLGFWSVLIQAAFSYLGTEIVAICAGEAKNPRRNLPKAIRRVYVRIIVFYFLGTLVIGWMVPADDERLDLDDGTGASSPFVIAIDRANVKVLPSIINACLLSSAWSAGSSDLYTSSRALYGMALTGGAPRFLAKTTKGGLPYLCIAVGTAFGLLAYMASSEGEAGKVFGYFANMTSVSGMMTWVGITITYIRFHKGMKVQNFDRSSLPYVGPFQPYAAWFATVFGCVILLFNGFAVFINGQWDASVFVTSYFPLPFWFVLQVGYKYWFKCKFIDARDMDLVTNARDVYEEEEDPPKNKLEAFWRWIA